MTALAIFAGAVVSAFASSGQEFQIRLLTPLASYSKVGARFEAKIIGATSIPDARTLPPGTHISGRVSTAGATGLGFRRERAVLELEFDACTLPSGESVSCDVTLTAVDNARERVIDGRIRGVLAARHPNSWLSGVWYRPDADLIHRSAMGLTGAGGMLYTRLMPGPMGAVLMIGSHLILFRMPEPEIELPSGTDLIVQIDAEVSPSQAARGDASGAGFPQHLLDRLAAIPAQVDRADDVAALDLLNIALVGTRDEVMNAFANAGWSGAEERTAASIARTYFAYAAMKRYATAPVSPLYNGGRLPDLVFQKSFNSLARRHHVRLWEFDVPGGTAWVGAATHDTGIAFNARRISLTHRIDPQIDREKRMLINDLREAGCLGTIQAMQRPELSQPSASADNATTNGAMTVAALEDCTNPRQAAVAPMRPHRSFLGLLLRQVVLDTRNYVARGNAYYWLFQGIRRLRPSSKHSGEDDDAADSLAVNSGPAVKSAPVVSHKTASSPEPSALASGFAAESSDVRARLPQELE